jgi:hypothetical protein
MTPVEAMFHVLQGGPEEGTLSFETHNQTIKNISKDIDVMAKKAKGKNQENESWC